MPAKNDDGWGRPLQFCENLARCIMLVGIFCLPSMGVLAKKGLVPLGIVVAVAALASLRDVIWRMPRSIGVLAILITALLAWAWLSVLWALDPVLALSTAAKLTAMLLIGAIFFAGLVGLPQRWCELVGPVLCLGIVVALAIMAIDLVLEGGLRRTIRDAPSYYRRSGLNSGITIVVILVWPASLWLWRFGTRSNRPVWCLTALMPVVACAPFLALLESDSAKVGFGVGVTTFVMVVAAKKLMARLLGSAIAIGILAAPALPLTIFQPQRTVELFSELSQSAKHRLYIWEFTARRIAERPFLGWGIKSSRTLPGGETTIADGVPNVPVGVNGNKTLMSLHPHNAPLQMWVELGFPGAFLFAAIVTVILLRGVCRLNERFSAGAATAALMTTISVSSFSWGVWQSWWLGVLWFVSALTVVLTARQPLVPEPVAKADR